MTLARILTYATTAVIVYVACVIAYGLRGAF